MMNSDLNNIIYNDKGLKFSYVDSTMSNSSIEVTKDFLFW